MLSIPKADGSLTDDELANLSQRHLASVIILSRLQGDESQIKQPEKRISDTKLRQLVDEFIETELPAYDFFIARHSDKENATLLTANIDAIVAQHLTPNFQLLTSDFHQLAGEAGS
jgi:hypothetical protein